MFHVLPIDSNQRFCKRFNNVSIDSEEFPEVNRMFSSKGKTFQKTYDLQQSHQTIRCFYFVTIVTFRGNKFYRKIIQTNQKTLQESFTRNNIIIIGIVYFLFLFLPLYASSFTSSRNKYFPNVRKFCNYLAKLNLRSLRYKKYAI